VSRSTPAPLVTREDLAALASKYAALAALRARREGAGDADGPGRQQLRDLSRAFPGALRELDTLGLPELRRRAGAAAAAAAGGPTEPWMPWILHFHRLLAAALAVKGATGTAPAQLQRLAESAAGEPVTPALVAAFLRPPGGRLAPLVLREVAARFGVPAATVATTLLPSRR
jgi:hypothetical protein